MTDSNEPLWQQDDIADSYSDPLELEIVDLRHQAAMWQEVAETLWEELQEWHYDECHLAQPLPSPYAECMCHRILATMFDNAAKP